MKTKALYLLMGLSAGLALGACTDNDTAVINGGLEDTTLTGNKAYMVVKISDVGAMTKATGADDEGEFQYGQPGEQAVADAHFYFYDDDQVFVTEASVWSDGTGKQHETDGDDEVADDNIEFNGKTVITLKGLTNNTYPTYMVTVLNRPENFTAPNSLEDFETALSNGSVETTEGGIKDADGYFTMSTTSYVMDTDSRPEYFVNVLTTDNFALEPISTDTNGDYDCTPITVYVERLAAKVTLNVGSELKETEATLDSGEKGYPITHEYTDDYQDSEDTPYYVRIDGWKLNATARYSYMVKDIKDYDWSDTTLNFTWNDASKFRSYWGKSYGYNDMTVEYPDSSADNDDSDETTGGLNKYLKYTSLSGTLTDLGDSEYCAENTNTAGTGKVITLNTSSAITSILVKATLLDANGNAQDYVNYDGLLWTPDNYKAYVLNHINSTGNLNVYYNDGDGENEEDYFQIDESYVTVGAATDEDGNKTDVDGYVRVILNEKGASTTFYKKSVSDDGTVTFTAYSGEDDDTVQAVLDAYFNDTYGKENAIYYTGGAMYYNIPIEHLNDVKGDNIAEANYGVVRNHHYYVTITDLQNLGRGIFDPEEVIIPQKEVDTYWVSSQVNILSWKIVEQTVEL